eukprot:3684904-Pyramimonas_sp.AAC.1
MSRGAPVRRGWAAYYLRCSLHSGAALRVLERVRDGEVREHQMRPAAELCAHRGEDARKGGQHSAGGGPSARRVHHPHPRPAYACRRPGAPSLR